MMTVIKYLLLAILSICCLTSKPQFGIINLTFEVKDTNTIFAEVVNYIKVTYPIKQNIKLLARHSNIEKVRDTLYKITVKDPGRDTFDLVLKNKIIFRKVFDIKKMTPGNFYLGAIRKKSASKEEVIANGKIMFKNIDCNCFIPYRVVSYIIKITSDKIPDADRQIVVEGPSLNQKAIAIIRRLRKNDVIEFSDIVAIISSGCPRGYLPFSIQVD